ncbi:uncharacterized protein LOC109522863 [Hippocampus comes]|uniref:uncharacterized protein LOC109522863 n=1 Tax=Hippocampus comes TaxID=109280 RepID=UPI00094EA445|nr:PREDICTED: uncharacterized protein LOC109522863 [Hippocampus comes]
MCLLYLFQSLHLQARFKKQKGITETGTAEGAGKSQPSHSMPTTNNETDIGEGQDTNTNERDAIWINLPNSKDFSDACFEIIDLNRVVPNASSQTELEYICYDTFEEADTVVWDSDDSLVRMDQDEAAVTIGSTEMYGGTEQASQLLLPSANELASQVVQSLQEEGAQTAQDSGPHCSPQDLFSISSRQLSPSTSPNNLGDPRTPWHASICRIKVVDDLLSVFMDSSIMEFNVKIKFVNEKAIDDAGVSREGYSAFWEQFLEQCEGETERVPRLRPDFCEAEWQAVGRIWVKGLLDHGVMPVRLSKAFVLACIHGIDSVDRDILISSFLNYLPPIERSASMGLQVDADDVEELVAGHDEVLNTDDLIRLQEDKQKEAIQELSSEDEEEEMAAASSESMKTMLAKWSDVQAFIEQYHPEKTVVMRIINLMNGNVMPHFRKTLQVRKKQVSIKRFFISKKDQESPKKQRREATPEVE